MSDVKTYVPDLGNIIGFDQNVDGDYSILVKGEKDKKRTVAFFTDTSTSAYSSTAKVGGSKCLTIDVTKMGLGDVRLEGTTGDYTGPWHPLGVTNPITGNKLQSINHPGTYFADVSPWVLVRIRLDLREMQPTTVKGMFLPLLPEINSNDIIKRNNLIPSGGGLISRVPTSYPVTGVDKKNNVFYSGAPNYRGYKTADFGLTWTEVFDFTSLGKGWPTNFIKLDNGAILATLYNSANVDVSATTFYLSDINEQNFTQVHTFETPGTMNAAMFGLNHYKNVIVATEYGSKTAPNTAHRGYLSVDYGKTWTKIFEGAVATGAHLHDICYDPYDDVIWIVQGDDYPYHHIWYTEDWGITWKEVWSGDATTPFQATHIMPLPNCVLFTSDCQRVGVMRWDRIKGGIRRANRITLEQAFDINKNHAFEPLIGTRSAVTYGDKAAAYFGFTELAGQVKYFGTVFGTANGYDFYPVWRDEAKPVRTSGLGSLQLGVAGVTGVTDSGDMLVTYDHQPVGQSLLLQLVHLKAPDWV